MYRIDEKYCVVQFIHPNKCRDEIFSAVPSSWLTADGCCLWPKANVRSCIIKCKPPSKDWNKHAVKLCGKYGTYQLALRKERKLSNYSSDSKSTESDSLGRGLRIKKTFSKISKEHSELESDQNDESDSSITESIPSAVPDHDDFETILENGQKEIIQPVANNDTKATEGLRKQEDLKCLKEKSDDLPECDAQVPVNCTMTSALQSTDVPPHIDTVDSVVHDDMNNEKEDSNTNRDLPQMQDPSHY
ncbi:hypothetical protein FQA39_LY18530 [Lamprigera yunnana]|nr:hypothetical protein FQA39_LY18530 [Lamprigera yunnana]